MTTYHLFEVFGIEIEYAIVDRESLDVRPLAEAVLCGDGEVRDDVERGAITWCNELAAHVFEIKTTAPFPSLRGLGELLQDEVAAVHRRLEQHGAMLLPSGMHPWMRPDEETVLWPHGNRDVYRTFDRIFGCKGHGFGNVQSVQLNLPFCGDDEFGRLHAAVRALLPLLPALAASSPFVEGTQNGALDRRMLAYGTNSARVPAITGRVVPENAVSRAGYERRILGRIYRAMAGLDPEGVLRHEWVNARGAIARFDRSAIEIRVLDTQEHPAADIALLALIVAVLEPLTAESWCSAYELRRIPVRRLAALHRATVHAGGDAVVDEPRLLRALQVDGPLTAAELWSLLRDRVWPATDPAHAAWRAATDPVIRGGTLARRLLAATGERPDRDTLREVYRELCACLAAGTAFSPRRPRGG